MPTTPYVQTVLGPVDPNDVGGILHHEHLLSLTPGPWLTGGPHTTVDDLDGRRATHDEDQIRCATNALHGLQELGINTIVDLSPYGVVGRTDTGDNVALLAEISRRTGMHIVTGTAVYLEDFSPTWTRTATLNELTDRFIADAQSGIANTGIRAGILGEQATGLDRITDHEQKCLRAAARAQIATGLALITHTTHGTMALEQVDILRSEGADLTRVVIGHMDTHPDQDYIHRVLDQGVNIAFDTIGKQHWDFRIRPSNPEQPEGHYRKDAYLRRDTTRADRLATIIKAGHVSQVLLAHDLTGLETHLNPDTHGQWGFTYLPLAFAALLAERDVDEQTLQRMVRDNASRILRLTQDQPPARPSVEHSDSG